MAAESTRNRPSPKSHSANQPIGVATRKYQKLDAPCTNICAWSPPTAGGVCQAMYPYAPTSTPAAACTQPAAIHTNLTRSVYQVQASNLAKRMVKVARPCDA